MDGIGRWTEEPRALPGHRLGSKDHPLEWVRFSRSKFERAIRTITMLLQVPLAFSSSLLLPKAPRISLMRLLTLLKMAQLSLLVVAIPQLLSLCTMPRTS